VLTPKTIKCAEESVFEQRCQVRPAQDAAGVLITGIVEKPHHAQCGRDGTVARRRDRADQESIACAKTRFEKSDAQGVRSC
jgi:hypothetical protein